LSKRERSPEIAMAVRALQRSFDAFEEAVAAKVRVNRTDLRCLDVVLAQGRVSAGELAAALGLSPAATTTVMDRMERAGYISRSQDPQNRRRVIVEPTPAARAVEVGIYLPVGAAGEQALSRFTEDQLATIAEFLRLARRVQDRQTARVLHTATEPQGR